MEYLAFRNLVGVSHTEAEVKVIAEEVRFSVRPKKNRLQIKAVQSYIANPKKKV